MVMAKHKKNGKNGDKKDSTPWFDISQETRNSIYGIGSFIVAIVSVLAFVGAAGTAGNYFNLAARSLFGWGFFIIPVAFVMFGVAFIKSINRDIARGAVFGTVLFVLASLAIFFIIGSGDTDARLLQGGYLGVVLGFPLEKFVGFSAGLIILIAFMVISVLLTLNVPIYQLVTKEEEELKKKLEDVKDLVIKKGDSVVPISLPKAPAKAIAAKTELSDKEFVIKNLKLGNWTLPPLDLLNEDKDQAATGDINANASIIKRTLSNFGIEVEMGEVSIGPTVTQFTMRPAVGVKLSRITALNPDLALALAAHPIRIEAPIPGKSLVGIEVPNTKVATVGLRTLLEEEDYQKSKWFLPLAVGRDVAGASIMGGLEKMPHLLIAGATGTGKSVVINTLLLSLLCKHSPDILKLILVDPKRVELSLYNEIPHLITPVITDNKKVVGALKWALSEMDRRYDLLQKAGSRDIFSYNAKITAKNEAIMPFIVIVIDEMADLMATYGRDVEAAVVRLAQMSRAVGIHLILSTQRPSVEVITGLIKANITSRIALQVASQIDSRTILDMAGAEKLLGKGDMLFVSSESSKPRRVQGPLVTEKEVKEVVDFLKEQAEKLQVSTAEKPSDLQVSFDAPVNLAGVGGGDGSGAGDDDMYEDAKQVVMEAGKASASLLQRRLRVGYARAARLLDILEENGIIGPGDGAKPRDVYAKAGDHALPNSEASLTGASGINADTPESENENT
jgi:S-DNA-T family DNA segregation ATPase FtsK/SpoIIIE